MQGHYLQEHEILHIFIVAIIGLTAMFVVSYIFKKRSRNKNIIHERYLGQLIELVIIIICLLDIFSIVDPSNSINSVLIKCSALVVAILGFAAQTAISDIICGLLISVSRPFEIGDRICIEGIEPGVVEDITLRHTVLLIYDELRIIIPNSELSSKIVTNTSYRKKDRRGIHMKFSVSYETDVQLAMDVIRDCVNESPYTLSVERNGVAEDSSPVYFLTFADSALILETTIFVLSRTSNYVAMTDINLRVNNAFKENNIEIPYNYLNVINFKGEKNTNIEHVDRKKLTSPSKRHFRSNTIHLQKDLKNIKDALALADNYSVRQRLTKISSNRLHLLTEESINVIQSIISNVNTLFWIEGTGYIFKIHISFTAKVGSQEYKRLLDLSSSGKNEAVSGLSAKIWEIMLTGVKSVDNENNKKDEDYEWSINDFEDNEDIISQSLLTSVADDIKISVTRNHHIEFVVIKNN
ncbi:MAG: mechanosensitive ion channel family protein [Lachnospiraceae bacterium]|nr:mechanosensitive ion channel family protein [Lachnospiraceae bacterium]